MSTTARALLATTLMAALALGCSGRRGRGDRPMVSRDAGTLPGMDAGATTDDGGGEDAGGGDDPIRGCFQTCTTVDDCVSSAPTNDADNYECSAGVCEYLGCNSDAECSDTFDGDYRCLPTPGGLNGCFEACATVDDCVSSAPTNDTDNWQCNAGVCDYLGCNSDAECSDTFDGEYTCRAP